MNKAQQIVVDYIVDKYFDQVSDFTPEERNAICLELVGTLVEVTEHLNDPERL